MIYWWWNAFRTSLKNDITLSLLSHQAVLHTAMGPIRFSHLTEGCERWPPPLPAGRAEQVLRSRAW